MAEFSDFLVVLRREYRPMGEVGELEATRLFAHYSLLLRWNRVLNLTRIAEVNEAVRRHYCESLALADRLPPGVLRLLDFGSGAGFPGIPVAIRRADAHVTLAESHVRKSVFLREASRDLRNVSVAAARAEEIRGNFDWVMARAVRWHEVLAADARAAALLLGTDDARDAARDARFSWELPEVLPWGSRRVLLVGKRK